MTYPVAPLTLSLLRRRRERVSDPGRRYVAARTLAVGSLVGFLTAAVAAPPDPFTQLYYWLGTYPVAIAVALAVDRYWLGAGDRVTF
ncbi:hypothetical protein [Haloarcula sp. JP-L23]|uniref:hypothetical protein n=1 Tax=Haloarcula sp. JP-L23 TaxID=2716717 RepID=UPI00140EABEF|nr:hypothetical protein G9465_13185 [Haloarcula sp. JP-L23]